MIVSFVPQSHLPSSFNHNQISFVSLVWSESEDAYHFDGVNTVRSLVEIENISGIILPVSVSFTAKHLLNYSPLHLCLTLRCNTITRVTPIFLLGAPHTSWSQVINKNFGIFNEYPAEPTDFKAPKKRHLISLFKMGKQLIAPKGGRHAIANRWGAYQLQNTLSILRSTDTTTHLRTQLCSLDVHLGCELTLRELTSSPQTNSLDHCRTLLQDIEELLARDNESPHRILVIEDELELGWQLAYEILFQIQNVHIDFCESKETFDTTYASKVSNGEYSLILLDMRLNQESDPPDVHRYNIKEVSGIQVLQDIKERDFNTPVIMTTASNKAWTLESASEYGANGFWSKESPLTYTSQEETVRNCQALLETIKETLSWSLTVRPIIQKFTECTDIIMCIHDHLQQHFTKSQRTKCKKLMTGLQKKKKYLQSLLHKPESKFIQQYTGNRQWEYPYLIIWSLQNDFLPIVSWNEERKDNEVDRKHFFTLDRQIGLGYTAMEKEQNQELTHYIQLFNVFTKDKSGKFSILDNTSTHDSLLEVHQLCSLIDILLVAPDGTSHAEFVFNSERRWKKLRNKINIIHGRPAKATTITPDTIEELLSFYLELLDKTDQYVHEHDIYAV